MTTTENALEPMTLAIDQLADIIAGCAVFQESVEKYSTDEAREFVKIGYHRPPEQLIESPFALIYEATDTDWERLGDGVVMPSGALFLELHLLMESTDDPQGEERRFNNWRGQIAQSISTYNGAGYRMTTNPETPPTRTDCRNEGAVAAEWHCRYIVEWSPFG